MQINLHAVIGHFEESNLIHTVRLRKQVALPSMLSFSKKISRQVKLTYR
jgi:hypothetical protein